MRSSQEILLPRVIRASAGTGKTRDLSSRYIGLLALGESPDRILATTFTKKAAGEIRERVFSRLAAASQSDGAARELGESFAMPDFTCTQAMDILSRLVRDQHRLLITTLDGFFISIVRSFALELGFPIDWRIASGSDQDLLIEEAVRDLFERNQRAVALELVRAIHRGSFSRSVHQQIIDDVRRLYQTFLFSPPSAWSWVEAPAAPTDMELNRHFDRLMAFKTPETKQKTPNSNWQKALEDLRTQVALKNWDGMLSNGLVQKILSNEASYSRAVIDEEIRSILNWYMSCAERERLLKMKLQLGALFQMLTEFDSSYRSMQRRLGVLGFSDVKQSLARSALLGELDSVYYRLDSRINHLLLDEFQDTSVTEWRILQPFADEILAKGDSGSFFCVGDIKQAIYGWRGGEAEIFASVESRWPQVSVESKQTTYRCAPAIIEFVNSLFYSLSNAPCLLNHAQAVTHWSSRFEEHHAARRELSGLVKAVLVTEDDGDCSQAVVPLIVELVARHPGASIGVLVRSNEMVAKIISSCATSETMIDISEEGGNPLVDASGVRVILSWLRYLSHPGDHVSRYHLEQSGLEVLFKLPAIDDLQALDAWRQEQQTKLLVSGYGCVLSECVQRIAHRFSRREQVRMDQLIDLGYRFDSVRTLQTEDFIEFVRLEKVGLPSEASVRVMTIHQSKGLEFDIVILPELEKRFRPPSGVLTDSTSPIEAPTRVYPSQSKEDRAFIPAVQRAYQQAYNKMLAEQFSTLYVAVTRARQAMYLLLSEKAKSKQLGFGRIIAETFFADSEIASQVLAGSEEWTLAQRDREMRREPEILTINPLQFRKATRSARQVRPDQRPSDRMEEFAPENASNGVEVDTNVALVGKALHALFELVHWSDDFAFSAIQCHQKLGDSELGARERELVISEFERNMASPEVRRHLSRKQFALESDITVYREQAYAYAENGKTYSGVIDRLEVEQRGGTVVSARVIDFKTGVVPDSVEIHVWAEKYRQQVESYELAVRKLTGAAVPVKGFVLATKRGELIQLM